MVTRSESGGLIGYFVRHRTAANLLLVLLVLAGLAAAPQMRVQYLPDIVFDDIDVTVRWDNAGPEEIDRAILGPLLPALRQVDGVVESDATAREGVAAIELEFAPRHDMRQALADVQDAVDQVRDLPQDAETPVVRRESWGDRVTDVVITGPVDVAQLARFADDLVQRLFEAGLTDTTIRGIADPLVTVEVPTAALIRHDITLREIAEAVAGASDTRPAGEIEAANARLRSGASRRSAAEIAAVTIRSDAGGGALTVGDVATVTEGATDRETAYFVGDAPALSIRVNRGAGEDAVAMRETVAEIAGEAMRGLPPGVTIDLVRARADRISERLGIVLDNGLVGLGLVLALLFLFLNARTAFWVAAGIPVAMSAAVALMYAFGVSLNMVSLFGLIITLGIVVDDAIVVGEHADWRARHLGEPPSVAAERAARRMSLPVISAALTTIIAFWALVVIGGRFGGLIRDIPVTVIAVLVASLVECFLILPNHMAHALAHSAKEHWYDWPSRQVNRGFRHLRERLFRPFIILVIRARYPVLAGAIAALSAQGVLFISGDVQWRFFNAPEQGSITANFAMAPGATRADTLAQMRELQRATDAVAARLEAEHGADPVDYVLAQIGGGSGGGLSAGGREADLTGSLAIELIGADERPYSSFDFLAEVREETERLPMLETLNYRSWRGGPGGDALDVRLYGAEAQRLKRAAEALKRQVAVWPEVSALDDSMAWDKAELRVDLTPQALALGFDIDSVGRILSDRLSGVEALRFAEGPRTGEIRVEVPDGEKTADFLDRMLIRAPEGGYVPLADLVRVDRQPGFSTIRRQDGLRSITVSGDIDQDDPARAAEIMETLQTRLLPDLAGEYQVQWEIGGLAAQEQAFLADAATGFVLCLAGIFLVLAWIFSSWTRPLVIMAVIPFGLVGAIWGHYVWDVPLSMFSVVGLLGMTGIIINDSIVLISTVDEHAETRGLFPAIVDATCDRLRPVLLTTLTTVLGLAPLLYETSEQAQFLRPTVITLVYGLGFGMVLVLLVVPALLAAGKDIFASVAAGRRALVSGGRAGAGGQAVRALALVCVLWFAATLGGQIATGTMPLAVLVPALAGWSPAAALGLFAAGAALAMAAVYATAAALILRRRVA